MTWTFSDHVRGKGRRYLDDHRVRRDIRAGIYWVKGTAARPYRVQTDADPLARTATWIVCSCPHGDNIGAGAAYCSHSVAVLLAVLEGTPLAVGDPTEMTELDPDELGDYVYDPPC